MYYYYIAFSCYCSDGKESNDYAEVLKKLWKQLILQLPESHSDEPSTADSLWPLPKSLWGDSKSFFQLVIPKNKEILEKNSELKANEWLNISENTPQEQVLEDLSKEFNDVNWNNLDYAETVAEELHDIADSINKSHVLNIYWITCKHAQCIESSDNIVIHGALRRLQKWNKALITFVCHSEILCEKFFTDSWLKNQNVYVVSKDEKLIQDNNLIWQGSLECLGYDKDEENHWCLSRTKSSLHSSSLECRKDAKPPCQLEEEFPRALADNIKIIGTLPKSAVPLWKLSPFQFVLYHKSLLKQIFELQEKLDHDKSEDEEASLLASVAIYNEKHQVKTTKDWMEFITSKSLRSDKVKTTVPASETCYFVLYPVDPGVFLAHFIRPQDYFINLHSLLAIYPAIFPSAENDGKESRWCEDNLERRWLLLLDAIESSHKSPLKSQFSLAVHLDAFEMLKHFRKDGKPMKKEMESVLKQIDNEQNISPSKRTEIQGHEMGAMIEYCADEKSEVSASAKLLPKHETLSICNTPKTLAKAKLHDVKHTASKNQATQDEMCQPAPTSSTDKLEQLKQSKRKKLKQENPGISNKESNKETVARCDASGKGTTKKKRRSFDGNKTVKTTATDAKEKRSDRHKRRLAQVVKRTLIKYGVDTAEEYFTTCSERLYYMCKSFLKDLQTSEGLNNEMKKLAESNVATVVEFEKRRHTNKATERVQTTTTNS